MPHSFNARALALAAFAGLIGAIAGPALAQNAGTPATLAAGVGTAAPQLVAPDARITDQAIQADHDAYEAIQARIKAQNDAGRRVADYHLAKAQCWLDVSFHEYTRNDRSAFPQEALGEADALLKAMEAHQSPISNDTNLVNNATKLRPDLWALTERLKHGEGFVCAAQKIACSEVELVHAGNEFNQQGWRHAKPYVQIAEDLVAQASEAEASCRGAAPATPLVAAPPAPASDLIANVVFFFDRHERADVHPGSVAALRAIADSIKDGRVKPASIDLVGYADRLNGTGRGDYNEKLSRQRAQTIEAMLTGWGVDAALIHTSWRGDDDQIESCKTATGGGRLAGRDLQECLLPNRRVQVIVHSAR